MTSNKDELRDTEDAAWVSLEPDARRPGTENVRPVAGHGPDRLMGEKARQPLAEPRPPSARLGLIAREPLRSPDGPAPVARLRSVTVASGPAIPVKPVLVIGGAGRYSLAVTRALGRSGIPVILAAEQRRCLSGVSRFAKKVILCPSPDRAPRAFVAAVAAAVREYGVGLVMPISEVALELLLKDSARIPARVPFGPLSAFKTLNDKRAVYQLARELQVPVPRTVIVERGTAISARMHKIAELGYPVVMKPYRSRMPVDAGYVKAAVRYAASEAELLAIVQREPIFRDHSFLVQERIDGTGAGVFLLTDGGKPRACFGHRRLREYPPTGGVSVLAEGVIPEQRMRAAAEAILARTGWTGVAMVEFKVDRHGTPYLLEVNARFWGTLQLAVDSGVNFPALLYRMAAGMELSSCEMQPNRRNHWFIGDLASLSLTLRSDAPILKKLGAFGGFVGSSLDPRVKSSVFQWDDPIPGGLELWAHLTKKARSR